MAPSLSFFFFFLLMIGVPPAVQGNFVCMPVIAALAPCLSSLYGEMPGELCCDGVTAVSQHAQTALGKAIVCQCLKDVMRYLPLITPEKARGFARQCNVEFVPPTADASCFNMTWPSSP